MFGISGLTLRVWDLGFSAEGLGFRIEGLGFGIQALGFRASEEIARYLHCEYARSSFVLTSCVFPHCLVEHITEKVHAILKHDGFVVFLKKG